MLRELNLNWAILLATVNRDELMCNIQRLAFHTQVLCLVCRMIYPPNAIITFWIPRFFIRSPHFVWTPLHT